jgi:hypothetical protein
MGPDFQRLTTPSPPKKNNAEPLPRICEVIPEDPGPPQRTPDGTLIRSARHERLPSWQRQRDSDSRQRQAFSVTFMAAPVPDLRQATAPIRSHHPACIHDILAAVGGTTGRLTDEQQAAASQLVALMGHTVRVGRDGKFGTAMISYRPTMPHDLRPLVVLDASGRVRTAYGSIERHWGIITRLRSAVKDYSPLTVHVWSTGGGKTAFENKFPELVKGIADTILTRPNEQWLAVVHKTGGKVKDVEQAVCRQLHGSVGDNLHVITWGQHMATNAFADVPNVILAGTLFMRDSHYTALAHLAKKRHVKSGLIQRREVDTIMRGEHAHMILQALCRGRVRKSDGAKCLPMEAYVIASSKSRIGTDITRIFPGCRVVPWRPVKKEPSGLVKSALAFVQSAIDRRETWISFNSIAEALGVHPSNFRKWVRKKDDWEDAIDALGLELAVGPRRAKGLRVVKLEQRSS